MMESSPKDTAIVSMSPPTGGLKRDRSDDDEEESTRRVVSPRTEERSMADILTEDLRSNGEAVLTKALSRLQEINSRQVEEGDQDVEEFFQLGGQSVVVRVMNEHPNCKVIQQHSIEVIGVIGEIAWFDDYAMNSAFGKVKGIQAVLEAI